MLIFLVVLVFNSCILYRETRKRQQRLERDPFFPSKTVSVLAYLCIALGPSVALTNILRYFSGICLVTRNIDVVVSITQGAVMESFQLSRLYHCFSAQQVHSKEGYPIWLFIVVAMAMTLCVILQITINDIAQPTTSCGIDNNGDVFYERFKVCTTRKYIAYNVND